MRDLVIVLGFCMSVSLFAQESGQYSFTLEEARQYALENNQEVKNVNLDVEAAKKKIWETTAIGLPQVSGTYDFQYLPGDIPSIQFDPNAPPIELGVAQSATYNIRVSQLVFSGEYIVGLQASKTYLQLSQNAMEKNEEDIKEEVSSAYYTILVLERNKTTVDSSVINLTKIVNETKAYVESGFMEDTELEQLQITLNTIKNSQRIIERQIEIAYKLFKIKIGINMETKVELKQNLEELLGQIDRDVLLSNSFELQNDINYKILETNEQISRLSLKREKSTFLPKVSAFYLYQDKTNKADFDITFNNIIGVSVSVPIFSSGQKLAKVSQAKIELEKVQNTKEMTTESIQMNFVQVKNDFNNAYEKYKTEKSNFELSKRIYNKTAIKYKQGMASGMDLTQANNQYLDSYSSFVSSMLDLLTSKTKLDKIYNKL